MIEDDNSFPDDSSEEGKGGSGTNLDYFFPKMVISTMVISNIILVNNLMSIVIFTSQK